MDDWSSRSVTSARPASNKLNVSGDVSSNMLSAVRDINYGPVGSSNMGHTTLQGIVVLLVWVTPHYKV